MIAPPIRFSLEPRPPFRLDLTVWALRRRPANIVDRWDGVTYRRTMRLGGRVAEITACQFGPPEEARLDIAVTTAGATDPRQVQAQVSATLDRILGLDVDLGDFYERTRGDAHLGPLCRRYRGLKPPRFPTVFECLANAVACQQLTLSVGIALLNRLAERFGAAGPTEWGLGRAFPEAADLLGRSSTELRHLGLSTRKAEYLLGLADAVADGSLDLDVLSAYDNETVSAALQAVRGIGRWSAEYAMLRGLGRIDVFPGDDVGARNNLSRRLGLHGPLDYQGVRRAVERWAPYAGLAYFHLLLERIDHAGWLDGRDHASDRRDS